MATAKPRYPFCWVCSRRLRGNQHAEAIIDGERRIVHHDCAKGFPSGFDDADEFNAADAHGSCAEEE